MADEMPDTTHLSSAAVDYLRGLRPERRATAREWADEDNQVFKMRVGSAVDEIAETMKRIEACIRNRPAPPSPLKGHVIQAIYATALAVGTVIAVLSGYVSPH